MTQEELEAIEAREAAATPGPWVWDVHSHNKIVYLRTDHSGYFYVMGFQRWGPQSAAPTFQVYEKDSGELWERESKGMFRADKLTKSFPGKEHHVGWDDYINHPDAEFIAHSRQDVEALLAEVKSLIAETECLARERDAAVADLQEAATAISYQSICKLCSRSDCCVAYERGHRPLHCKGWQWRGVRE